MRYNFKFQVYNGGEIRLARRAEWLVSWEWSGYLFWSGDSRLEIPDQGRSHVSMMRSENTICNLFAKRLIDRIECKIYQTSVYLDHGLANAKTISGHSHDGWATEHKGAVTRANCLFIEILRGHHYNCPVLACNSSFEF